LTGAIDVLSLKRRLPPVLSIIAGMVDVIGFLSLGLFTNSAGPLVNRRGQAIGINTVVFTGEGGSTGIAFAIPTGFAEPILTRLAPGSVLALPGDTFHFHWAKSGEYITQVTAIGPLGLEYRNPKDDPRAR